MPATKMLHGLGFSNGFFFLSFCRVEIGKKQQQSNVLFLLHLDLGTHHSHLNSTTKRKPCLLQRHAILPKLLCAVGYDIEKRNVSLHNHGNS